MALSRILPPLRMVSALLAVKARMSSQEARDVRELGAAPADRGLTDPSVDGISGTDRVDGI
jgi:hypothetical protein